MVAETDLGYVTPYRIIVTKDIAVFSRPLSVWNLLSNEVHKISNCTPDLFHADADENVLITFQIDWSSAPKVWQTKWSLTGGKVLHGKQFHVPIDGHDPEYFRRYRRLRPVEPYLVAMHTYGQKTVTLLSIQEDYRVLATLHLIYDHTVDRLSIRWINSSKCGYVDERIFYRSFGNLAPHISYHWDDHPYGARGQNAITGTTTVRPYKLNIREVEICDKLGLPQPFSSPCKCCGDNEVCSMVDKDYGMQLWFFNPDFAPDIPGAEPFEEE